jgi:CheY-like chemotaxis protein
MVDRSFVAGKRFVVVEDDILVAQAMTSALEGMGGEVRHFHKATDALHHCNIEHSDCFIVDYMLGGAHNGIQFLNQLRQKLDKPIRAVLVTGDTSATLIREAANSNWPVLYKPVNLVDVIANLSAQAR